VSRLSWGEIRQRARNFAKEFGNAAYEKGETQTFYNEFFEIFGVSRKRLASFERRVKLADGSHGFIDVFWPGKLLVEQKSAGRSLTKAQKQALGYFEGLKDSELPEYVLASDFQNFTLLNLLTQEEISFKLGELPDYVRHFGFIIGQRPTSFENQDPVSIKASVLMGRLHDALYANGYQGHDLERFLVRLLFCLFADDTGIFGQIDIFHDLILNKTKEDGSDVGRVLSHLFQVLDTEPHLVPETLDNDLKEFPHINGELFRETLRIPSFNREMRQLLLDACAFNWRDVSPAIFGAQFQHVSGDAAARRAHGEHYTTENHIMRVIRPLFLDELQDELTRILERKGPTRDSQLRQYCEKLAKLRFFDPACGCGNFLVVAYREIRRLETQALVARLGHQPTLDIATITHVDVHQFFGIEINEFPARIAEVAMWMMDHIMNVELGVAMGQNFARIPLRTSPSIHHADALVLDWRKVVAPSDDLFVFGNPPFLGAKYQTQHQREQVRDIAKLGKSGGTLDFVCAWYVKAAEFIQATKARISFVSTNSICQGEQVAQLWPILFEKFDLEIAFAHRTFEWSSDAKGKAHVHCVIIGLTRAVHQPKVKRLFHYETIRGEATEQSCDKISPYLLDASHMANSHVVVRETTQPLFALSALESGTQPIDDGLYLFDEHERNAFINKEPDSKDLFRPYVGTTEMLGGKPRFLLFVKEVDPKRLANLPFVRAQIEKVRASRLKSGRKGTRELAMFPTEFQVSTTPAQPFLAIPEVSSEKRDYIPIAFLKPPTIPSNLLRVLCPATLFEFGILTSAMHMAWMRAVGGRLESRYRYSVGIVYNPFPWPDASPSQRQKIESLAQAVLDARDQFPTSTLAQLYDPVLMPPPLRKAHRALDTAVDRLYRGAEFTSDADRFEFLLDRYDQLSSGLVASEPKRRGRKPRV
jgi:hypothetical protein